MINIEKIRTLIFTIANKGGRGTLAPAEFNSIIERALYAWTKNQISNESQFQQGQPIAQTSLDLDQASIDRLRHLKETRNIRVVNGLMPIPDGVNVDVNSSIMPEYWTHSRLSHRFQSHGKIVTKPIDVVKDNEWALRLGSSIVAPTKSRAIANYQSNSVLIEPADLINLVTLSYIRMPLTPEWGYNIVNNRPVYVASKSTDVDAPKTAFNEISMLGLELLGIRIRENELVQAAAALENKGV